MDFRICLYRIGEKLTRQSLDQLTFLCQLTGAVSVSRIEQVRSATDLFSALEEKGKLSKDNLEFLAQLLTSIDHANLLNELAEFHIPDPVPRPTSQDYLYTECLLNIARGLTSTDLERLVYILGETYLHVSKDHVFSATQLFKMLHQRQLVSPNDMKFMEKNLHEIGRTDLCKIINGYHMKIGQPTHVHPTGQEMQANRPAQPVMNMRNSGQPQYLSGHPVQSSEQMVRERSQYQNVHPVQESQAVSPTIGRSYSGTSTASMMTPNRSMSESSLTSSDLGGFSMTSSEGTLTPRENERVFPGDRRFSGGGVGPVTYTSHLSQDLGSQVQSPPVPLHQRQQLAMERQFQYLPPKQPPQHYTFQQQEPRIFQQQGQGHPDVVGQRRQSQPRYPPLNEVPEVRQLHHQQQQWNPAVQQSQKYAFGLLFDPFEKGPGDSFVPPVEGQKAETNELLQELGLKEGELSQKEKEIENLKLELTDAHDRMEGIIQERVGEVEVYTQSIRNLEDMLKVKNEEVQSLIMDVRNLHERMEVIQASNNAFDPEELYPMTRSPHGLCIIINNHQFFHRTDPEKAHTERGGAKIDEYNLTQTFRYLRYKVELHENLTSQQMNHLMMQTAQRDHSEYDSFICCILTHGESNLVHGADSESVNLLDLAGVMKMCGSLRGKPKLFFIQACRGDSEDEGFEHMDIHHDAPTLGTPSIPQEADFFFGYATPLGNAAYRSRRHGSWYISELCKVLTKQAYTHNLSSMMKKVNFQVSKAFTKDGHKQAPEFVDRLRKEVHFFHFSKAQKREKQEKIQQN